MNRLEGGDFCQDPVRAIGPTQHLLSQKDLGEHDAFALAAAWFAIGQDVTSLTQRWQDLEGKLMGDTVWASLSREDRLLSPVQVNLTEIDDLRAEAQHHQYEILEQLVLAPTRDVSGALAKLSVVLGAMFPEDYPHCYELIRDAATTLKALSCPLCQKPLVHAQESELIFEAARSWDTGDRG